MRNEKGKGGKMHTANVEDGYNHSAFPVPNRRYSTCLLNKKQDDCEY